MDHVQCGVPVPVKGQAAVVAVVDAVGEFQCGLGFRTTLAAQLTRVHWVDSHHSSTRSSGFGDENLFRDSYHRVTNFTIDVPVSPMQPPIGAAFCFRADA